MSEDTAPVEDALPDNHPGVEDGHVDMDGEKVVFEYEDGELVGWHKEPAA